LTGDARGEGAARVAAGDARAGSAEEGTAGATSRAARRAPGSTPRAATGPSGPYAGRPAGTGLRLPGVATGIAAPCRPGMPAIACRAVTGVRAAEDEARIEHQNRRQDPKAPHLGHGRPVQQMSCHQKHADPPEMRGPRAIDPSVF
jgi:hypothetical protein